MVTDKKTLLELIGILIVFGLLFLFSIGSNAEKLIICLLGLIYWKLNDELQKVQ